MRRRDGSGCPRYLARPGLSGGPPRLAWRRARTPHRPPAPRRGQAAARGLGAGRIVTPPTRPTLPLSRIKLGQRFRRDLGNIDALTDSIREVGLLHPIVVDADGNLIAGQRRLAACHLLGMKDIPVTIVELDDAGRLRAEQDENITPKSFTPSEAVAIAAAIKDRVKTPHGGDRKTSESRGKVST